MELSDKSEMSFFKTKSAEASWRPSINIRVTPLKFEAAPRLLGVYLDRSLVFTKHVDIVKEQIGKKCRMLGAVANTEWGWRKNHLTKLYNCQVRTVMDYGAPAWQPWLSDSNVEALEKLNQRALRMVTGQSVGSCREAIRLEAGVPSYQTIRKRNILAAKERALRTSADHPAFIAATNPGISQRLKVRKGFRVASEQLSEYLPPGSHRQKTH